MGPKRRSAGGRTASNPIQQQSTLSFHGKTNKITKPGNKQDSKLAKKEAEILQLDQQSQVDPDSTHDVIVEPSTTEKAIQQQADKEAATLSTQDLVTSETTAEDILGKRATTDDDNVRSKSGDGWVGDEEQRAAQVTDSQIKRYWQKKEQERLAPRVHQEDLTVHDKVLREWDMSGQYGPCIGIARLKRWKRANLLGLDPPIEVLAVLLKEMKSGAVKSQIAYVDELLSLKTPEPVAV